MNETILFCNIMRKRSEENQKSFNVLFINQLYGNCFSVLRQELDSIVRAIYLLKISDLDLRKTFICQTLKGEKWSYRNDKGKRVIITDKMMVDFSNDLIAWSKNVYKFGCGFIHLSNFHNYLTDNPFEKLSIKEKQDIIYYMHCYHGALLSQNSSITEFIPYLPNVMDKITSNLRHYIAYIEREDYLTD